MVASSSRQVYDRCAGCLIKGLSRNQTGLAPLTRSTSGFARPHFGRCLTILLNKLILARFSSANRCSIRRLRLRRSIARQPAEEYDYLVNDYPRRTIGGFRKGDGT
jgi:hypothetical protein